MRKSKKITNTTIMITVFDTVQESSFSAENRPLCDECKLSHFTVFIDFLGWFCKENSSVLIYYTYHHSFVGRYHTYHYTLLTIWFNIIYTIIIITYNIL